MIPQYVPWIDRPSLANQINEYILSDGYFTEFKHTEEFERRIADFLQVKYCVVVNNGTISLSLALLAYGIKPGDRVLVPNITMIATCNAVKLIGAVPVFVDVEYENICMDISRASDMIVEENIKAVIYVTFNGRSHSFEKLSNFERHCNDFHIPVIYDNAQSFGSCDDGGHFINCGDSIGSFSFSMPKIITTGQGGCLVTNDYEHYQYIRKLKDFGRSSGGVDHHESFGINCKFTEMQAIMGINQIESIYERVEKKKAIYDLYRDTLKPLITNKPRHKNEVPWFVDIYIEKRDELKQFLFEHGINTRIMYPALTNQPCNIKDIKDDKIFMSREIARTGLWLPSSLNLSVNKIDFICCRIKEFLNG